MSKLTCDLTIRLIAHILPPPSPFIKLPLKALPTINKFLFVEGWVSKLVARQLATAVLWVRIQTSLKNHKWATSKGVADTL